MSIFDFFRKKPIAKKTSTSPKKGAPIKSQPKKELVNEKPTEQLARRQLGVKSKATMSIIENMNGLPSYHSVISADGADLGLSVADQVDFVILKLYADKNDAIFIRSINKTRDLKVGVDHTYLTIKERLKNKNLKIVQEYLAERQIIKLIYDKSGGGIRKDLENKSDFIDQIDSLLKDGTANNISDIHIEVRRDSAVVRFRKHGDLYPRHDWSVQYAKDASLVLYQVMAEEKDITFNPSIAQDAVLDRNLNGKRLRVRVGTIPATPDGFDVVLRLMPYDEKDVLISELGYIDDQLLDIEMGMSRPIGVIVLAGVTGSGKTTSLVAMIRNIIKEAEGSIKVITVENPPEQFIRGATQYSVSGKSRDKDITPYAAAARAALRVDPDIFMVGEVRDMDTAKLLISAVQSGHKVFTTIHAPSGIGIVGRMRSLGIPNDVLGSADFFSALIYQTLIKTICPHCSIPLAEYRESHSNEVRFQKLLRRLALTVSDLEDQNIRFVNKKGCKHPQCDNGVTGRTVVAEVIIPDHQMNVFFAEGKDMEALRHFRKNGGRSCLMIGVEKMKVGLLDPYDVEKSLGLLNAEIIMEDGTLNYNEERISLNSWPSADANMKNQAESVDLHEDEGVSPEMDMFLEKPSTEFSDASKFTSEIFNNKLRTAEVISIKSRTATDGADLEFDPSDDSGHETDTLE